MVNPRLPVPRVPLVSRIAYAVGLALAISVGQAGAQAPTQLAPSIRDFAWVDPMDRTDPTIIEAYIASLPKLLSGTGLYRNIGVKATRAISDTSLAPFQINSALWSDGAHKERFISLLPGSKVVPTDSAQFTFPDGAVLIKNFLIDTVYGLDFTHSVRHNGQLVGKRWRYPSSRNCNFCHRGNETDLRCTLGFITPQLKRVVNGTDQLQALFTRGILSANPVAGKPGAHRWYGLTEDTVALEQRVRSYFASNCSHCHNVKVPLGLPDHDFDYFDPSKRIDYQFDSSSGRDPTGAWVNMPSKSGFGFDFLIRPGYPDSSAIMNKMRKRFDGHPQDPAFRPSMRQGRLSITDHMDYMATADKVELRDYRGRKVELVRDGKGEFRIPRTLNPGIYFLVAGQYRVSLNYIP